MNQPRGEKKRQNEEGRTSRSQRAKKMLFTKGQVIFNNMLLTLSSSDWRTVTEELTVILQGMQSDMSSICSRNLSWSVPGLHVENHTVQILKTILSAHRKHFLLPPKIPEKWKVYQMKSVLIWRLLVPHTCTVSPFQKQISSERTFPDAQKPGQSKLQAVLS